MSSLKVTSPVQRLMISAAIGSALKTRSGASSTQPPWASLWTSRTPRGRRGRASGVIVGAAAGVFTRASPYLCASPPPLGGEGWGGGLAASPGRGESPLPNPPPQAGEGKE